MRDIAIKFENISKQYRLGSIGTGTLSHDLNRWWAMNIRGKEDPNLKIGQVNDRASKSTSDYVWALRDIDFEVKQGEVLGIIGKNGAGKSTLLKILSRVTSPTTGRIMAHGRIASLLEVGTGFHPEMTGRENIYMNGAIMGMTKAEITRKLDEIIDFAGIEKYIDTPVKRYSSGMTVRLGFAIAAHLEPEILVVDEVLAVGDAEFQKKAIGKMQDISHEHGRTVLFVSHNMISIESLCSRTIILNNGQILFDGKTKQAINEYHNQRSILGEMPLKLREDRQGTKNARINACRVNSIEIDQCPIIRTGSPVEIELDYISNERVLNPNFWVSFYDRNERPVMKCNSETVQFELIELPQSGTAVCKISKLQLLPGEYTLNIALELNNQIIDRVENIGRVSIEPGVYYSSNKNSTYDGIFLAEYLWNHKY